MKQVKLLLGIAFMAIVLSSCDENVSKITDVAKQFVEGVVSKDKVTIYELYPNIKNFTNLQLPDTLKVENIKVELDKTDSVYIAKLNDKQSLVCLIDSEGVKICDSYNVLKLDSLCYDLAAKTGFPVKHLSDMTVGQMFSDDGEYITYLEKKYPSAANGNLYYSGGYYSWGRNYGSYQMSFDIPITNTGEHPVNGEDYKVEITYYRNDMGTVVSAPSIVSGVDLAPGEMYVFTTYKNELYNYNPNTGSGLYWTVNIIFKNASKATLLDRYGSFTGKEYDEFFVAKEEKEKAEAEKSEASDSIKVKTKK